jgi:hypothetical protein
MQKVMEQNQLHAEARK